jgi:predicted transcriptional regulator
VKRRYKDTLNNTRNIREFLLLKIIQKLIYTQRIKQDQELVDDIMLLLSKIPVEQAENDDVVNYNRWLLKKLA